MDLFLGLFNIGKLFRLDFNNIYEAIWLLTLRAEQFLVGLVIHDSVVLILDVWKRAKRHFTAELDFAGVGDNDFLLSFQVNLILLLLVCLSDKEIENELWAHVDLWLNIDRTPKDIAELMANVETEADSLLALATTLRLDFPRDSKQLLLIFLTDSFPRVLNKDLKILLVSFVKDSPTDFDSSPRFGEFHSIG